MTDENYWTQDNQSAPFESQDVYFPKPLPKPSSIKRELFIDYGNPSNVYLYSTSGRAPLSQKQYFQQNDLYAKNPTLPMADSALKVDYPFVDRVMGDNLSNIKKARSFCYYVNKIRGAWLSKVPYNHLKPLKRVIDDLKNGDCNIHATLDKMATPSLRKYIYDFQHLLTANIETYNSDYVGGCLTSFKTDLGKNAVCFPSGKTFSKLSIRHISPDETDSSFYHYDEEIEINIGSSIYEVDSTVIRDTGYCALRCDDNKCHLLTFHHADFSNTLNTIETVGEKPTSMCLSPYIEGESLIATDSGTVHIWRVGKGLNAVILNKASRFHCNDKWRQVHYGACPQELVVADRTVVEMFDRRTRCESSIDLFALPNKILVNSERISAMQGHPTNPYYHIIATDYSLLLVDQRFPGHSVMYWNHLLLKTPALMSVYQQENYNSSLILLASQYPAETCCYQFQQISNNPVYSTQTPWRLSKISDICQFDSSMLNTYSLLSEKRLDTSLCGITVLPGTDKQSLLTLQLDCHGELFYQVYSTNYSKDDLTCSAGPGYTDSNFSNDAKLKAKTWMSSLESHVSQFCEERDILKMTIYDHSDKYHDLKQTQPGHVLCPLCLPKTCDSDDDDSDDEPEETCPSCSLPLTSAKTVYESEKEGTIANITCNGFEMFDSQIPPYTKLPHASAHSGILINLWKDEPNISKLVIEADKNAEKYKRAHQRKLRILAKKAERRKEHFKTLRRNGHDLNEIYFKNNRNPSALDHFLKELAALYTGEDPNQIDDSESVVSMSTITMSTSSSPGSKNRANLTLLASESQNLTLLQQMNPSTGSSSHTDAMSVRSLDFSPTAKKSNKRILSKRLQQMQGSDSEASGSESRNPPTNSSKRKSLHKTLVSPSQKSIEGFKIPSTPAPKRRRHNTDTSSSSTVIEQNTQDDNFKIMEQLNESMTTDNKVSDILEKSNNFKHCTVSLERLEDTGPNETENSVPLETVDVDQRQVEESAVKTKKKKKKHNDTESSGDSDISVSSSTSNQSMFSTVLTENDREGRKQKKKKKHKDTENSGDSDISVISNTSNQSMFSNAFTENDTAVRKQKKKKKHKNHNEKETDTEHGSLTDLFSSEDDGSVLSLISGESDLSEHSVPQKLKHKKKQKKSKDNLEDSTYNIVNKEVINNIFGAIDTYENQNPISYCSKENETNAQNNRDSIVTDDKKDVAHTVEEYDKVAHETTPKETTSSSTVISSEAEDNSTLKLETDSDHGNANSKDGLKPTLKTEMEELPLHDSIPPSPYSVVDSEEKINVMSIPDISKHSQSFAASPVYNPISDKRKKGDCQPASRYLDFGQTLKDKSTIEDVNDTDARPTAYASLELIHTETESFSETLLQGDTVKVELEDSLNIKNDNQTMCTVKSQDEKSSTQSSIKEQKQFSTSVVGDPYPTKHINVTRSTQADDISIVDRNVSPSTSNIKSSPHKHKLGKSGSPSKKDRNKNRTSVSSPESNRNDSPSKREKGSSPSKRDRNVSTSKNRTSVSSPVSNRNDSPSKREKSSSSSKREKSSSPSKSKRNVSPSERERSVSPSKSHRNVSPSKRERSVSPSKNHRNVSPSKRERRVSPSKSYGKVSPSKSVSLSKSDTSISLSKNDSVSPSKKYRRVSSSASDGSLPPSKSHSNSKETTKTSILPSKQSRTKSDKGSFSNKIRNISSSKSDKTPFSKIDKKRKISHPESDEIKNNPPSNSDKTSFSKIDKNKNVSPVEWNETLEPSGYLNESVSNVFDDSSTFSPTMTSTQLHHKPLIKNKPSAKKKKKTFVIGF
ncbi:hypothetical protein SNE40_011519 [Patella caerulea]|uniref:TAF1C beta-propeller domain-containing protein n=1 Tax=Patella caerulea TaxID=87958 RepID=A0AAN8PPF9_PATCE